MMAHVAQAGEQRGRVVLRLMSSTPSPLALEAAVRVARAFQSEIESLFVEDRQLFDICEYAFAQEVSITGREKRQLSSVGLAAEMHRIANAMHNRVEAIARLAEVPARSRNVRDEPIHALVRACAECGPWNVIALAEPIGALGSETLARVLDEVPDATGVLVVGPRSRRLEGPIVAVVEDEAHLAPMLQAAQRLRTTDNDSIILLLAVDDPSDLEWAEGQARLVAADRRDVRLVIAPAHRGEPAAMAECLRRQLPGFVIAMFGGLLVPRGQDLRALAAALEAPMLLVR